MHTSHSHISDAVANRMHSQLSWGGLSGSGVFCVHERETNDSSIEEKNEFRVNRTKCTLIQSEQQRRSVQWFIHICHFRSARKHHIPQSLSVWFCIIARTIESSYQFYSYFFVHRFRSIEHIRINSDNFRSKGINNTKLSVDEWSVMDRSSVHQVELNNRKKCWIMVGE